jgi:hypothetical protein
MTDDVSETYEAAIAMAIQAIEEAAGLSELRNDRAALIERLDIIATGDCAPTECMVEAMRRVGPEKMAEAFYALGRATRWLEGRR